MSVHQTNDVLDQNQIPLPATNSSKTCPKMSTPTSFAPKENTATVTSRKKEELLTPLPETKDEWDNCKFINCYYPKSFS